MITEFSDDITMITKFSDLDMTPQCSGDIMNSHPATYYHYEPLLHYDIKQARLVVIVMMTVTMTI